MAKHRRKYGAQDPRARARWAAAGAIGTVASAVQAAQAKHEEVEHAAMMKRVDKAYEYEQALALDDYFREMDMPVTGIGLSERVTRSLIEAGITNVGKLITWSRSELLAIHGIGPAAADAIVRAAEEFGWPLKKE